jgi:hypothetical protein
MMVQEAMYVLMYNGVFAVQVQVTWTLLPLSVAPQKADEPRAKALAKQ